MNCKNIFKHTINKSLFGLFLLSEEWNLDLWVLYNKSLLGIEERLDFWQVLDVSVPSEKVIILVLLFISHFDHAVVEFSEHKQVPECQVIGHKECSCFEVLLQMLCLDKKGTFLNSLPSLRLDLTFLISFYSSWLAPRKNPLKCGRASISLQQMRKTSFRTSPSSVTREGTWSLRLPFSIALMAPYIDYNAHTFDKQTSLTFNLSSSLRYEINNSNKKVYYCPFQRKSSIILNKNYQTKFYQPINVFVTNDIFLLRLI